MSHDQKRVQSLSWRFILQNDSNFPLFSLPERKRGFFRIPVHFLKIWHLKKSEDSCMLRLHEQRKSSIFPEHLNDTVSETTVRILRVVLSRKFLKISWLLQFGKIWQRVFSEMLPEEDFLRLETSSEEMEAYRKMQKYQEEQRKEQKRIMQRIFRQEIVSSIHNMEMELSYRSMKPSLKLHFLGWVSKKWISKLLQYRNYNFCKTKSTIRNQKSIIRGI